MCYLVREFVLFIEGANLSLEASAYYAWGWIGGYRSKIETALFSLPQYDPSSQR